MFEGYDPERKPPYLHEFYFERNGNLYKTIYYVCRGYGDSISISSSTSIIVKKEDKNEKSDYRKSRQ
jgi:hypothetical protein